MPRLPSPDSPGNLVNFITHTDLYKAMDEASIQDVEAALEWVYLPKYQALFQKGDAGNCLFVVVAGQVAVALTQPDGSISSVDDLTPGSVVGEMGLFTGQMPVTAVYAVKRANLVKLSKQKFDHLSERHPQLLSRFSQLMSPRLRSVQLVAAFNRLFGPWAEQALEYLEPALEWLNISTGDILVRQGDVDDSLYIVVSGSLSVIIEGQDNSRRTIAEIGRGESIGELALLTGELRSATVQAIRDTVVVRLTKPAFERLIARHPEAMVQITRLIVERYQRSIDTTLTVGKETATLAIIPAGLNAPVDKYAVQIVTALKASHATLHLNSQLFDAILSKPGAAQTPRDDPTGLALETWLSEQEALYRYVVYEADPDWTPWTMRCLRNADRILLVGAADDDPRLSKIERRMHQMASLAPRELILFHPEQTEHPSGTMPWLIRREIISHHHVRLYNHNDLERLSRRLTNSGIGLVLSGGGARAFAQIGAIKAIREAGVPIDLVGGTSLGSVVAAAVALGWNHKQMVRAAETFFSPSQVFDYTFPAVAFANSKKMSRTLEEEFGGIQIEDMWLSYFCVSSNLTRAKQVLHQHGPLWRSLRASCSLPGIFTPVVDGGDLLVDGAVMNNLPVDIMYKLCQGGVIIAVDVSAETDLAGEYEFTSSLSGWKVLWSKLNPFVPEIKAPSIMDTLKRSTELNSVRHRRDYQELADIFINPPVTEYGLTEFDAYETLIEAGYQAAKTSIARWQAEQTGSKTLKV